MPTNFPQSRCSRIIWRWLGFAGIGVLFVALRWNNFNTPLTRDEGEYAYAAQLLERGGSPYQHAFIQKPPMVIYSYAFADWLMPQCYWSPRILAGVFVALATVLLGYAVWLEFGTSVAWLAMWLTTLMIPAPELDQFAANTEMFLLLPLLTLVAVFVREQHRGYRPWHWWVAGFAAIAAVLYKYTVVPLAALIFIAWVSKTVRTQDARQLVRRLFPACAGVVTAAALMLGFFIIHDGGRQLWECTVLFNCHYVQSGNFGLSGFWFNLKTFWSAWWILFLLSGAAFLRPAARIWFWACLFGCAWLCTGASVYGHYYILLMPFWAVLAANGIKTAGELLASLLKRPSSGIVGVMAAITVFLCLLPDLPWIACPPARFSPAKFGGQNPFAESPLVANRVAELSAPDDLVFIAGSEPQILCYAHRFSPTRFITMYPLMIPSPLAPEYQREAIQDLEQRLPTLIVLVRANTSWLQDRNSPKDFTGQLKILLGQDYTRIGGFVPDATNGFWAEPLSDTQFDCSSLVLFKRKPVGK
jgi:hypothetical protein